MTREEAIEILKAIVPKDFRGNGKVFTKLIVIKAISMAIKALEQEPRTDIEEKIHKMKTEIADTLEFWDYSPNNNPLARDMLETITNFWGEVEQ